MRRSLGLVTLACLCLAAVGLYSRQQAPAAAPSLREDFHHFLFEDRQIGPLNAQQVSEGKVGQNLTEKVRITTEAGQDAFVRIVRPDKKGPLPVVLVQHYLGGTKDDPTVSFLLNAFAGRGYLAAAIDGRYRGERGKEMKLPAAIRETLRTGKGRPWLIDTVFDDLRTIDYLLGRPDVDSKRLAMVGVSEGGIETWMAAAADERIQVAVPVIGVTRFQYVIEAAAGPSGEVYRDAFQDSLEALARQLGEPAVNEKVIRAMWERLLPGFTGRFDAVNLVPLIAPRPLLIIAHEKDEIIPLKGAQEVYEVARKRYDELGAADRLEMQVDPGLKHAVVSLADIPRVFDWVDHWLKSK
jgi:dienelactone hydrolase